MLLLAVLTLQQADLVVTNARIYTSDVNRPVAEALAVRGGRIAFVGSNRGALALAGPRTERLDLTGKTVITGMVDAHAHLLGLGQALRTVDLVGTRSYDEVIARVVARAKAARPGEWIRGRGWDQNDWADTRFPTHGALSRAVPNNPVYLTRVDGHAALVNAKALELAGVAPEGIAVYEELAREGRYSLRNYVMVRSSDSVLDAFMQRGPQRALYEGRLWIRAIKLVADGALGSRGAALLEPYSDDPGNMG